MKKLLFIVFLFTTISFSQGSAGALSESFKSFWKSFTTNVLNEDIGAIMSQTRFPFEYNMAAGKGTISQAEFTAYFKSFFNNDIVTSIVYLVDDYVVDYENENFDFVYADVREENNEASFGVVVEGQNYYSMTLFFKKINGEYYFTKYLEF